MYTALDCASANVKFFCTTCRAVASVEEAADRLEWCDTVCQYSSIGVLHVMCPVYERQSILLPPVRSSVLSAVAPDRRTPAVSPLARRL